MVQHCLWFHLIVGIVVTIGRVLNAGQSLTGSVTVAVLWLILAKK